MKRYVQPHFIFAILLLNVAGCIHESSDGPTKTFTYELWVPLSVLLIGVVAVPSGWFLRKENEKLGWGLLVIGSLASILFAPSLFRDRAIVDDSTFSLRTGIWGLTAIHEVKFQNLKQVRIVSEQVSGRRGMKRTNFYFLCERNDGTSVKVPVANNVSQAAAPYFLKRITDLGIPILDET